MTVRRRARCALISILALALLAPIAHAQEEGPTPDVPGGAGRVEGRIEPADDPAAVANAEIILYSLSDGGDPGLRRGRADAEGRFAFEDIDASPSVVYLVGTRVGDVPFGARFGFEPGSTRAEVRISVSAPSANSNALAPGEAHIVLTQGCSDLRVQQIHEVVNPTDRVVFVPPDAREGATPPLEFTLPEGASAVETPLGNTEGFEQDGRTLRFWGPVYAGEQRVEIGYGVAGAGDTLEIGFAKGSTSLRVFTPKDGLRATGPGLRTLGEQRLPTGPHLAQELEAPTETETLALRIEGTGRGVSADTSLTDSRMWVEVDDALARINEVHQIETAGTGPLQSTSGRPLVCIGLPEGAENLRFSAEALELGLSRDPSGALALHGPLPPGVSTLALRYDLTVVDGRTRLDRRFESALPLLSVLVADTGVVPVTDRLHRKRAVRTQERNYLHLEGFAIRPDEHVPLVLQPLESRAGWPAQASTGVLFGLALLSLLYLSGPLRAATPEPEPESDEISTERAALYAAIDALDEDFETGKLAEDDHQRMRAELRARAARLIETERDTPKAAPEPKPLPFCPACGARATSEARFCAQCGKPLPTEESADS